MVTGCGLSPAGGIQRRSPPTPGVCVTARNFKGQFSSWPATAFFLFCGVLLLAMLND
ncbi:hypothetical protein BQ8420_16535 [Nocardiopsis sp. JB363]|nr:hypothetical protein BQ8420_16535 [Nocardiopsis sp. JB363]